MFFSRFGKGKTLGKRKKDSNTNQKNTKELLPFIVIMIGAGMVLVGVLIEIGVIC